MATWVHVNRAATFPEVIKVFQRAGGGGQSGKKGFLETVKAAVAAGSAWVRKSPGGSGGWQDSEVDVTAIPGVRALRDNGKWTGYPG